MLDLNIPPHPLELAFKRLLPRGRSEIQDLISSSLHLSLEGEVVSSKRERVREDLI